jgi:hypothetical protein
MTLRTVVAIACPLFVEFALVPLGHEVVDGYRGTSECVAHGLRDQRGEVVVTPLTDRAVDSLEGPPLLKLIGGGGGEEFAAGAAQSQR